MKEVISLKDVPFDIPNFLKNKELIIRKNESPEIYRDYYYISSNSIYMVYSFDTLTNKEQLLLDMTVHDVYQVLDINPGFKEKISTYLGN